MGNNFFFLLSRFSELNARPSVSVAGALTSEPTTIPLVWFERAVPRCSQTQQKLEAMAHAESESREKPWLVLI